MVQNDAAAPKSCLPSLEMRSPTASGGLLPSGEASTDTRTTFKQPPLRFYSTEEMDSKTSLWTRIFDVSYDSSFLPAAHSCRRVIEKKSGENIRFDPDGFQDCLRACPFLGSWCALLYGEAIHIGVAGRLQNFSEEASGTGEIRYLRQTYSGQFAGPL